jgi:flagellar hook assembly protein FlgD
VTIAYSLARPASARLRIYNVAGRLVRTLVNEAQEAGPHEVVWDGRSNAGATVGSGVYFYRLEAEGWQSERKVVVIQR